MGRPTYTETVRQDLFAEPLAGPISPDQLLDSFPDALYDKSPNSHFYRFVFALLGPSGVGSLVKNYFEARLKFLEYGVELFDIEAFYGDPFQFGRILEEQISLDVKGLLPEEEWQKIKAQDASYRGRAMEFFNAVRLGTTPEGMRLAAKSGYGHDVEIVERYKWIFDNVSDQPLGYKDWGSTMSLNEFTIIPRKEVATSEIQRIKFEAVMSQTGGFTLSFGGFMTEFLKIVPDSPGDEWLSPSDVEQALRALPNIGENGVRVTGGGGDDLANPPLPFYVHFVGPLANEDVPQIQAVSSIEDNSGKPLNIEVETLTEGIQPTEELAKIPDRLAHNVQDAVDRLRPVNSLPTTNQSTGRITHRDWVSVQSSSDFHEIVRFVTGRTDVKWPNDDISKFWIQSGAEREGLRGYDTASAHYLRFHDISAVHAFRGEALESSDYEMILPDEHWSSFKVEHKKDIETRWLPEYMIDPNNEDRTVSNGYIQGIYPVEYVGLSGVTPPVNQRKYWKSVQRKPESVEVVEIDLGAARVVNFISFDVVSAPFDIAIEYDSLDQYPHRKYVDIVPTDSSFSGHISLNDSPYQLQWNPINCQFTDTLGNLPVTRFIRLTFTRRADIIPELHPTLPLTLPFSIGVRGLKVGRNISP